MKLVRAKVHNQDFVELKYNAVSDKWEGLLQVPDTASTGQPQNKYNITLEAWDEINNSEILDRTDETFGEELQVEVTNIVNPVIEIVSPEPPAYKLSEMIIVFDVLDEESYGIATVQISVDEKIASSSYLSYEAIAGGRRYTFEPDYFISEGIHLISIWAEDEHDNISILNFNILLSDDPCIFIWDRTQADVDYVANLRNKYLQGTITDIEKIAFSANLKGARNRSDFVRILTNMIYMAGRFGIPFSMTVEDLPEIPAQSYVLELRNEIDRFRTSLAIHADTPVTPILPINTYQKMNDLEKILYDIHDSLSYQVTYYIDDYLYADGEIGLLE